MPVSLAGKCLLPLQGSAGKRSGIRSRQSLRQMHGQLHLCTKRRLLQAMQSTTPPLRTCSESPMLLPVQHPASKPTAQACQQPSWANTLLSTRQAPVTAALLCAHIPDQTSGADPLVSSSQAPRTLNPNPHAQPPEPSPCDQGPNQAAQSQVHGLNQWPSQSAAFEQSLRAHISSCLLLGQALMRGVRLAFDPRMGESSTHSGVAGRQGVSERPRAASCKHAHGCLQTAAGSSCGRA